MRKIIQLHECVGRTRALCNDGTLWQLDFDADDEPNPAKTWKWRKFPEIPQPKTGK